MLDKLIDWRGVDQEALDVVAARYQAALAEALKQNNDLLQSNDLVRQSNQVLRASLAAATTRRRAVGRLCAVGTISIAEAMALLEFDESETRSYAELIGLRITAEEVAP